jgi:hypothetical protein
MTGFSRYQYWFSKGGETAVEKTPLVDGLFELEPGTYTVTVKAFVGDETEPAADGTSESFTVVASVETSPVTVILSLRVGDGNGTFSFTLTYPVTAGLNSFTLTPLGGTEPIDLMYGISPVSGANGQTFSGAKTQLAATYWLARASLNDGDVYAGKSEVVHISKDMTTELN